MSSLRRPVHRRPLLWVAAVAVPLTVGAAVLVPMAASGAVDLPDKTAEELLTFVGASDTDALSGTIEQTSELGLPDLGALTGGMDSSAGQSDGATSAGIDDLISLLTGSHTAKVYLSGDSSRMQVLDSLGERNVYADDERVWYVDSETKSATKLTLPTDAELEQLRSEAASKADAEKSQRALPTPEVMLDQALARLDESTEVTVGSDARVAGRDVYELVLAPRTADTLVGDVRFAIDGETGVALAASITARGASTPTFEVAFTQVDFATPNADVFAFEPGSDIAVIEKTMPTDTSGASEHEGTDDSPKPVVTGEGWAAIVELPATGEAGGDSVFSGLDAEQRSMLESVTTGVEGGRVLQTSLLTVLITDDGRVLAGAVPASLLVDAAQAAR